MFQLGNYTPKLCIFGFLIFAFFNPIVMFDFCAIFRVENATLGSFLTIFFISEGRWQERHQCEDHSPLPTSPTPQQQTSHRRGPWQQQRRWWRLLLICHRWQRSPRQQQRQPLQPRPHERQSRQQFSHRQLRHEFQQPQQDAQRHQQQQ